MIGDRAMTSAECQRRWRMLNPEKARAAQKRYRDKHPDKVKSRWGKWYAENKDSHLAGRRSYYRENREAILTATASRNRKRLYGLTTDMVATMIALQGGTCAICKTPIEAKSAHVDHNHDSGKVRGILCSSCNLGLGKFRDDFEVLRSAAMYLLFYQGQTF